MELWYFRLASASYLSPFEEYGDWLQSAKIIYEKRIGLNSARIFVNGSNLFTFCNKALKDDPERVRKGIGGANLAYPLMRTYNFGLNINF